MRISRIRFAVILVAVLLLAACGNQRKEGWTDAAVEKFNSDCQTSTRQTLSNMIPEEKTVPVCACWTDSVSERFTFAEVESISGDDARDASNMLLQCMDDNGIDTEGRRLNVRF